MVFGADTTWLVPETVNTLPDSLLSETLLAMREDRLLTKGWLYRHAVAPTQVWGRGTLFRVELCIGVCRLME